MDETDRALIRLLRENARLSVSALAAASGVSRGTVQNRLAKLQADGTIQGFTVKLRADAAGAQVRAVTMVEVAGGRLNHVVRALRSLPEVAAVHTTNGRWDLVVELAAHDLPAFDTVLRRIRLIDGIANSETSLMLSDRP
jgi:DNA-binding Lrp family transcriptional regulator